MPNPTVLSHQLDTTVRSMRAVAAAHYQADRARLDSATTRIAGLDPFATLARGFAIVQDAKTRKVVSNVRKVKAGARLSVAVADGAFLVEVS